MIKTKWFIVFGLLPILQTGFSQGLTDGFMKAKGDGTLAFTYSHERAETYFFGEQEQYINLTTRSLSAYLAWGISDKFNLVASLPYMRNDSLNSALQDATVALKYQNGQKTLVNGRLKTLTILGFQFPASKYPTTTAQPIGARNNSFIFRFLTQYESNQGFFAHFQTGFDFRIFPEQQFGIPVIFRAGYGTSHWYVDAWIDYFQSLDNSADVRVFGGGGSRWVKTGGTVYVPIGRKFGVFGGGAYILSGRNIAKSWRLNAGLLWNWEKTDPTVKP
ncbi:MAG: hypothetical protein KDC34_11090 [Saprospiraceae bacterium]|nr:hypothetical protein [Saprospiraceae bacterium]